MSKGVEFEELVEEALVNAQKDRELTMAAYDKMEAVFDIDAADPSTLQSVVLVGAQAVKLLEQLSRTNEQIMKLAQLRQKDVPANKERERINMDDLKIIMNKSNVG